MCFCSLSSDGGVWPSGQHLELRTRRSGVQASPVAIVSLDKELYSTLSVFTTVLACQQALHLRVLARLASLAQLGELAGRLPRCINGYH